MRVKAIVDEDFINYKKPSMFIGTVSCGGKCCKEAGIPLSVCQNNRWRFYGVTDMDDHRIVHRYLQNPLTRAIVFGGLEPFEQLDEVLDFLRIMRERYKCQDDVVIYTGYYPHEVIDGLRRLSLYENIIVKFGRYIPGRPERYDDVLGVTLASDNQYAEKIC